MRKRNTDTPSRSPSSSWFRLAFWSSALAAAFVIAPFLLALVLNLLGMDIRSCLDYCDESTSDGFNLLSWTLGSLVFALCLALLAAAAWIAHFIALMRGRRRRRSA